MRLNPRYLERLDLTCTKCKQSKRPTRAYISLLKHDNLPYVCRSCQLAAPSPPMRLGKLGVL